MQIIKAAKGNINTRHGENAGRGFPHVGIDIGWGGGLELYAPADGLMSWGWVGTYGRRAIIRHGDGTWSLIAHAEEWFVNNVHVAQGQHIGTMGRTGGPWGSAGWFVHCHQEYHLANGAAVDPLAYMGSTAGGGTAPLPAPQIDLSEEDDMKPLYITDSVDGNGIPGWALLNPRTGNVVTMRANAESWATLDEKQEIANTWGRVWGSAKRVTRLDMLNAIDAIQKTS